MIWRENLLALRTWPEAALWWRAAKAGIPTIAIIALLAWAGGFLHSTPRFGVTNPLAAAAILFFVPAFAEELFFRGFFLSAAWRFSKRWAAWFSVIAFAAWHPFQALAFGFPGSAVFLSPLFIVATLILGMVLSHIRIVTRSLWPPILLHWLIVLLWKLA